MVQERIIEINVEGFLYLVSCKDDGWAGFGTRLVNNIILSNLITCVNMMHCHNIH